MTHDELHRILSHNDDIVPSSGFVASVMDAVRQDASAPAPIPFPWRRALPGIIAAGVAAIVAIVFFVSQLTRPTQLSTIAIQPVSSEVFHIIGALTAARLLTLASTRFARRFTSNYAVPPVTSPAVSGAPPLAGKHPPKMPYLF